MANKIKDELERAKEGNVNIAPDERTVDGNPARKPRTTVTDDGYVVGGEPEISSQTQAEMDAGKEALEGRASVRTPRTGEDKVVLGARHPDDEKADRERADKERTERERNKDT